MQVNAYDMAVQGIIFWYMWLRTVLFALDELLLFLWYIKIYDKCFACV